MFTFVCVFSIYSWDRLQAAVHMEKAVGVVSFDKR